MKAVVRVSGGMGNQFFQIGFGDYLSRKYKLKVAYDISFYSTKQNTATKRVFLGETIYPEGHFVNLDMHELESTFSRSTNSLFNRVLAKLVSYYLGLKLALRKRIVIHKSSKFSWWWRIFGGFFTHAFFGNWQNYELLHPDYRNSVFANIRQGVNYQPSVDLTQMIGLHYRRGDYCAPDSIHAVLDSNYYDSAVLDMKLQSSLTKILIFSDTDFDSPNFQGFTETIKASSLVSDELSEISLMASLDYLVTANSTFSLMAGLLGNQKKTIAAPKAWYRIGVNIESPNLPLNWKRF